IFFISITRSLFLFMFFFIITRRQPRSTLFPYTTLFRSNNHQRHHVYPREDDYGYQAIPINLDKIASHQQIYQSYPGLSGWPGIRSEEHTSELQSRSDLVCRLLLEKKKKRQKHQ